MKAGRPWTWQPPSHCRRCFRWRPLAPQDSSAQAAAAEALRGCVIQSVQMTKYPTLTCWCRRI
eukprot:scaffold182758_cov31-Prasinocladus_malaysianus.AAC.1